MKYRKVKKHSNKDFKDSHLIFKDSNAILLPTNLWTNFRHSSWDLFKAVMKCHQTREMVVHSFFTPKRPTNERDVNPIPISTHEIRKETQQTGLKWLNRTPLKQNMTSFLYTTNCKKHRRQLFCFNLKHFMLTGFTFNPKYI